MQFILIQVLDFLLRRLLSFDDDFPGGIVVNQPLIHGVKDSSLQLMVKVHGCLPLMGPCVVIQQLLVNDPSHVTQPYLRNQLLKPLLCHQVFVKGDFPDRAFFVDAYPLSVVVTEQIRPCKLIQDSFLPKSVFSRSR